MADIRTFFDPLGEQPECGPAKKRQRKAAAALPPVLDARGPCSILSWNCDGMHARSEDGKLQAYVQEQRMVIPDLVAFQETWAAWDTGKRGDLRQLIYTPRQLTVSESGERSSRKRDSLGLDDSQDDVEAGQPPATKVIGRLDPHGSRLLPPEWAEALLHGYWSCCSYKRRAGVGVVSRIEPLRVEWSFPGMAVDFEAEGRYICLEFEIYFVINLYVPNTGTDRLDARA